MTNRIFKSTSAQWFELSVLVVMLFGGFVFFAVILFDFVPLDASTSRLQVLLFLFAWLMFVALVGHMLFRRPSEIVVVSDGSIVFKNRLRQITLTPEEVLGIEVREDDLLLRHKSGQFALRNKYFNQEEFFSWLMNRNPSVEIEKQLLR